MPAGTLTEDRSPTLPEVLRLAHEARIAGIHTALPARVTAYDAAKQLVSALPLLKVRRPQTDPTVPAAVVSMPIITNVPVVFPGANGFRVTFPVTIGDTVLLVFSERSTDEWRALGGEQDPQDTRQHALSDAIALVGLHDNTKPWTTAAPDHMTLGADTGQMVHLKQSVIELGNAASQGVGLGDAIQTFANAMASAFSGHTHSGGTIFGFTGPAGSVSVGTLSSSVAKVTP